MPSHSVEAGRTVRRRIVEVGLGIVALLTAFHAG